MGKPRQIELKSDELGHLYDPYVTENTISWYLDEYFNLDKYFGLDGVEENDDLRQLVLPYVIYNKQTGDIILEYYNPTTDPNQTTPIEWELTDEEKKLFKALIDEFAVENGYKDINDYMKAE